LDQLNKESVRSGKKITLLLLSRLVAIQQHGSDTTQFEEHECHIRLDYKKAVLFCLVETSELNKVYTKFVLNYYNTF